MFHLQMLAALEESAWDSSEDTLHELKLAILRNDLRDRSTHLVDYQAQSICKSL